MTRVSSQFTEKSPVTHFNGPGNVCLNHRILVGSPMFAFYDVANARQALQRLLSSAGKHTPRWGGGRKMNARGTTPAEN